MPEKERTMSTCAPKSVKNSGLMVVLYADTFENCPSVTFPIFFLKYLQVAKPPTATKYMSATVQFYPPFTAASMPSAYF